MEKDLYNKTIVEHINTILKKKKTIRYEDKFSLWEEVNKYLEIALDNYDYQYGKLVFDNLFVNTFKFCPLNTIFINNNDKQKVLQPIFEIPIEYKRNFDQFNYLATIPQPEQKTSEWFKMREDMLTASSIATVINENPYENPSTYLAEKCLGKDFEDNINTYHGKKYEPIAQQIYSYIYNIDIREFGIIRSSKYSFLGASPDGIGSCYTLDGKFSPLVGRMLEIKCPATRKIEISGPLIKTKKTKGIIPNYYWCQMQLQMEVCDLDKCDFWQCEFYEYKTRQEYISDVELKTEHYEEQGIKQKIKDTIKKGCIIELLPKSQILNPHIYNAKYIFPPTIDLTPDQYDKWVLDYVANFPIEEQRLSDTYYFNRVIYWKAIKTHKITVDRDKKWFEEKLPVMQEFWNHVLYYREHKDELPTYLEKLRTNEPKLNRPEFSIYCVPPMYRDLARSMDLSCNPYSDKPESKKPIKKMTYNKSNSVFIKKPKLDYTPQDDFLSDT